MPPGPCSGGIRASGRSSSLRVLHAIARGIATSGRDALGIGWRREEIIRRRLPLVRAVFGRSTAFGVLACCFLPPIALVFLDRFATTNVMLGGLQLVHGDDAYLPEQLESINRAYGLAQDIVRIALDWTLIWGFFVGRRLRVLLASADYQSHHRLVPGHPRVFLLGTFAICALSAAAMAFGGQVGSLLDAIAHPPLPPFSWESEIHLSSAVVLASRPMTTSMPYLLALVDEPMQWLLELLTRTVMLFGCVVLALLPRRPVAGIALAAAWTACGWRVLDWLLGLPFDLQPDMSRPFAAFVVRPLSVALAFATVLLAVEGAKALIARSQLSNALIE